MLTPICEQTGMGRALQAFQTFEYVRNFLDRFAWSRFNCLLLISGAFAAFRREAVVAVGGFDPLSLTEDYELIHRLRRMAVDRGLKWRFRMLPAAHATTDAPAHLMPFLRQRRRWFAGFLNTHYWNRDMIAAPRFRAFGLAMMSAKTLDTLQPFYGLAASALLIGFVVTGRWNALLPASGVAVAKIGLDLAFAVASVEAYRRWTGIRHSVGLALLCALTEPFAFQILRRAGSAWGWLALASGERAWGHAPVARDRPAPGELKS
jgi:cellulose synthase/poly-beta-1,6-N-acetylglucosamine synthase-like glycosyltransferase